MTAQLVDPDAVAVHRDPDHVEAHRPRRRERIVH
jgi:hypothetical protein